MFVFFGKKKRVHMLENYVQLSLSLSPSATSFKIFISEAANFTTFSMQRHVPKYKLHLDFHKQIQFHKQ